MRRRLSVGFIVVVLASAIAVMASSLLLASSAFSGPVRLGDGEGEGVHIYAGEWWSFSHPGAWEVVESDSHSATLETDGGEVRVGYINVAGADPDSLAEVAERILGEEPQQTVIIPAAGDVSVATLLRGEHGAVAVYAPQGGLG